MSEPLPKANSVGQDLKGIPPSPRWHWTGWFLPLAWMLSMWESSLCQQSVRCQQLWTALIVRRCLVPWGCLSLPSAVTRLFFPWHLLRAFLLMTVDLLENGSCVQAVFSPCFPPDFRHCFFPPKSHPTIPFHLIGSLPSLLCWWLWCSPWRGRSTSFGVRHFASNSCLGTCWEAQFTPP